MYCNETPKIERCIICSKHCECEAESEAFSTDDFEDFRKICIDANKMRDYFKKQYADYLERRKEMSVLDR